MTRRSIPGLHLDCALVHRGTHVAGGSARRNQGRGDRVRTLGSRVEHDAGSIDTLLANQVGLGVDSALSRKP